MFKLKNKVFCGILSLCLTASSIFVPSISAYAYDDLNDNMEAGEYEMDKFSDDYTEYDADGASISYNYAKLLQYSLYFYDANMCGSTVSGKNLLSWRGNCHTFDKTTYTRADGSKAKVNLNGGFHDAGDHVKFGLPEAYAAFVLGMSYDTHKKAYEAAKQSGHLQTITTHFADYLVNCTVLNKKGTSVEAFCCQVGQGGGNYDHGYWGAPENQTNDNRPIFFTSKEEPSTDIVCLSAAALAMQYKNFGGKKYLTTAKQLFAYAKKNNKATNKTAGTFYSSSGWEDDYCLAALMLYQITKDKQYLTEFNTYKDNGNAQKPYWPLGWDNVGPAVAYYNGNSDALNTLMGQKDNHALSDGYVCMDGWGSARYNTSLQYTGLLYDKMIGKSTYRNWAEGQMKYLMGNNTAKDGKTPQCFIVGYNQYSSKYPHHRGASGYTGGPKGTTKQAHVLIGALVGGPKTDGSYTDSADDYQCNEVAIDYNATLVAASAAIYSAYTTKSNQKPDPKYYIDDAIEIDSITLDKTNLDFVIGTKESDTLKATIKPAKLADATVTWTSKDSSVAKVSSSGKVVAVAPGTTKITATCGNKSASCTVTVKSSIAKCSIALKSAILDYTGNAVNAEVIVKFGAKELVKDKDYTLSYKNNIQPGTATVTITGKGYYSDSVSKDYTIKYGVPTISKVYNGKKSLNVKWNAVKGAKQYVVYRKAKGQTDFVSVAKTTKTVYVDKNAKNGKMYSYKVEAVIDTNKTTVSKPVKYVKLKKTSLVALKSDTAKSFVAKWKANSKASGYQLEYSTSSSFKKSKKVTITGKKSLSKLVKKLKTGKKYYVRVRVYKKVAGKKYYSAWSAKKRVIIK